jgi:trimethylamine:corrinoid methyltransferase-like protein
MNRLPFETWRAQGAPDLAAAAAARVAELLASYRPPDDLDSLVRQQLDAYCLG